MSTYTPSSSNPAQTQRWRRGELVAKAMDVPREPNTLYAGWRASDGRALAWWLEQLAEPRLNTRLVQGVDRYA